MVIFWVCVIFVGGFDFVVVIVVCEYDDEMMVIDALDSLVRKSLVRADSVGGATRYSMLETMRHFAEQLLDASPDLAEFRGRHARYFGVQAKANFDRWNGPGMRDVAEWVKAEFDNLRAAFHNARTSDDMTHAAAIAAHTSVVAFALQRLEPVNWAEELLPDVTEAHTLDLLWLYTAASLCSYLGRHDDVLR